MVVRIEQRGAPRPIALRARGVMFVCPVEIDLAGRHRFEGSLHTERADVDVGDDNCHDGRAMSRDGICATPLGPVFSTT